MSDEAQTPAFEGPLVAEPATKDFVSSNYDVIQRSVLAGMGLDRFDAGIANRVMAAIQKGHLQLWRIYSPETNDVAGTITFHVGVDPFTLEGFLWIYSLHLSGNVAIEAWRQPFLQIDNFAKSKNITKMGARTKLDRVADIAMDNGFDVYWYLERS